MKDSFTKSLKRFGSDAGATLVGGAISAVLFAVAALAVSQILPAYVARLADMLPSFFFSGVAGTMYVYTLLAAFLMLIYRALAPRLYTYDNVSDGICYFQVGCGAKPSALLAAKYTKAMFHCALVFAAGAGLTYLGCLLTGADMSSSDLAVRIALVGLLTVVTVSGLQLLLGAVGAGKGIVTMGGVAGIFLLIAYLFIRGFLNMKDTVRLTNAAAELSSLKGIVLPAAAAFLLATLCSFLVGKKRVSRYNVEDLDDEMLRQLGFDRELEVYEKQDDDFALLFAGKDVLKDK